MYTLCFLDKESNVTNYTYLLHPPEKYFIVLNLLHTGVIVLICSHALV